MRDKNFASVKLHEDSGNFTWGFHGLFFMELLSDLHMSAVENVVFWKNEGLFVCFIL